MVAVAKDKPVGSGNRGGLSFVPPDDRPEIKLGPDIHRMAEQSIRALRGDVGTFQRAGQLVHVAYADADDAKDAVAPISVELPSIRVMQRPTLRERLSRVARFLQRKVREDAVTWAECKPPDDVVSAVYERGAWSGIPQLVGVVTAPTMRVDGSILQTPGYDATTGYFYQPPSRFPQIPEEPTRDDARDALEQVRLLFADFPFASPSNALVPIAAILTTIARPAIVGSVPAFAVDATTRGSGKTLAATLISEVANGRDAARASWPDKEEELEKIIGAYAMRGASLIVFDNITTPFCGGPIDRAITARDTIESRILGHSEIPTLPWRAVIVATGNNLDIRGDTSRRVLLARLEPSEEQPESRTNFRIKDVVTYAQHSRERLVCAALTVLRAYVVAGRPSVGTHVWGSFESWARLIPPAIVYAGGADVMGARITNETERDPDAMALSVLLDNLPKLAQHTGSLLARDVVAALWSWDDQHRGPDGFGDLRDALETLTRCPSGRTPGARQIGDAFRRARGRWVGGRRLMSEVDPHAKVVRWFVDDRRGKV